MVISWRSRETEQSLMPKRMEAKRLVHFFLEAVSAAKEEVSVLVFLGFRFA
jgi:hypothetical protein